MPRGYAPPPLNRGQTGQQPLAVAQRLALAQPAKRRSGRRGRRGIVLLIAVSFVNWAGWWTLLIPAAVAACYLLGLCAEALMHLADKHADAKHKRTHDLEEWRRQHIES